MNLGVSGTAFPCCIMHLHSSLGPEHTTMCKLHTFCANKLCLKHWGSDSKPLSVTLAVLFVCLVCVCTWVCKCRGQRSLSDVFLSDFFTLFLGTGPLIAPGVTNLFETGQRACRSHLSLALFPQGGEYRCTPTLSFYTHAGGRTRVLELVPQARYPLSQLHSSRLTVLSLCTQRFPLS